MDPGGTPGINTGILETVRYETETSPLQTHPNTEVMKISTPDSELSPVVTSMSAVENPHVQDLSVSDDQQVEGLGQSYERRVHETPQFTRGLLFNFVFKSSFRLRRPSTTRTRR